MNVYLKMRQLERESDGEAEKEQDPLDFADQLAARRQRRPKAL